jgi:enoyl-CoA hydratase
MTTASYESLRYEVRDRAVWITIHRPEKLNALDRRTVEELVAARERAIAEPDVVAIVVTGAGERAFVAGADVAEMAALDPAGAERHSRFLQQALDGLERSPRPVIAAINGFALGGGGELALACHLRVAAETARFGQPEVGLGLIPGAGGTQRLPRLVGRGVALELILTGNPIDAAEAHRIGLVNRVVPAAQLRSAAGAWVDALASRSPIAIARALDAVLRGAAGSPEAGLQLEASLFGLSFATADMREGTRAFLEKRKPAFRGH